MRSAKSARRALRAECLDGESGGGRGIRLLLRSFDHNRNAVFKERVMDRRAKNFVRGVESLEGRRFMAVAALSTMPLGHVATLAPLSFDYVLNGQFQPLGNGKDQILVDGSDYDDV